MDSAYGGREEDEEAVVARGRKMAYLWMGAMALVVALIVWRVSHDEGDSAADEAMASVAFGGSAKSDSDGAIDPAPYKHAIEWVDRTVFDAPVVDFEELQAGVTELAFQLSRAGTMYANSASRKLMMWVQGAPAEKEPLEREWAQARDSLFQEAPWFRRAGGGKSR